MTQNSSGFFREWICRSTIRLGKSETVDTIVFGGRAELTKKKRTSVVIRADD
jgi:hypothetical protein